MIGLATLGVSLMAIIFYKRIPLLNRVEKRWKRILVKMAMFLGPI
jgi:hypothetical protein